jgi:hypothetical protein
MKKSEMQSLVANMLRLYRFDNVNDTEAANRLLLVLEQEGMLPPPKETQCVTENLIYCYYDKVEEKEEGGRGVLDRGNSQLWESEE